MVDNELGFHPEYALLGAWVTFPDRCPVRQDVTAEWFTEPAARSIFQAIKTIPPNVDVFPVAVAERLRSMTNHGKSAMELIGGEDFLVEVMSACVPSFEPAAYEQLRHKSLTRKVREVGSWIASCADKDMTAGELTSRLLEAAAEVSGAKRAPVVRLGDIEHEGEDQGITTGVGVVDNLIGTKGYPLGQVTVVRAYQKTGKSAWMIASALDQARLGARVLYATFADLNAVQIKRRMLRNLCGWARRPESLQLAADYDDAVAFIKGATIDVYDASAMDSGGDVETFSAWLRAEHDRREYSCVFVDYAQELTSCDRKADTEVAQGNICASKIARLAAVTGLPIVVGSQVTEGGKDGGRDKTKYSRKWEEVAGWVLSIKRDEDSNRMTVESVFSRFGPRGITDMRWDNERLRMVAQ